MSQKYKIIEFKLTPVTPFFFGRENQSDLGNKNDYFQFSLDYPQQTTLLGFLRHKILRDNDINLDFSSYSDPEGLAKTLVGYEGFTENSITEKNYGMINSISPCFIINDDRTYLWSRDHEFIENKTQTEELCLSSNFKHFVWHGSKQNTDMNYLNKHHFAGLLTDEFKNEILHPANYVGTHKGGVKMSVKEDSFFIMEYRHLRKHKKVTESNELPYNKIIPLSFGFLACLKQECKIHELPDFMPMGKERSIFKVETEIKEENLELESNKVFEFDSLMRINNQTSTPVIKCILLSDSRINYVDLQKLNEISLMQITNYQRFRYIKRKTGEFFAGANPKKESKAFNLIAKGSVFFIDSANKDEFNRILLNARDFRQIGYNYVSFKNAKTI